MKSLENKVAIITGGAGLIGFTTAKEIASQGAKEVAGRKIRINTVHPGFVDSPMTLNILPEADL